MLDADSQIGASALFPKAGVHDCLARSPFPEPSNVPWKSVNHLDWFQILFPADAYKYVANSKSL
jgi:hypothetical protein